MDDFYSLIDLPREFFIPTMDEEEEVVETEDEYIPQGGIDFLEDEEYEGEGEDEDEEVEYVKPEEEEVVPEEEEDDRNDTFFSEFLLDSNTTNGPMDFTDEADDYFGRYTKPKLTAAPATGSFSKGSLREGIAAVESGGDYTADNPNSTAVGKYQFIWSIWNNDIKRITGLSSESEFKRNPELQEKFYDWYESNRMMPAINRLRKYNNKGLSDEQLGKLYHFKGEGGAQEYLTTGRDRTSKNNVSIPKYLRKYGGYGDDEKKPKGRKINPQDIGIAAGDNTFVPRTQAPLADVFKQRNFEAPYRERQTVSATAKPTAASEERRRRISKALAEKQGMRYDEGSGNAMPLFNADSKGYQMFHKAGDVVGDVGMLALELEGVPELAAAAVRQLAKLGAEQLGKTAAKTTVKNGSKVWDKNLKDAVNIHSYDKGADEMLELPAGYEKYREPDVPADYPWVNHADAIPNNIPVYKQIQNLKYKQAQKKPLIPKEDWGHDTFMQSKMEGVVPMTVNEKPKSWFQKNVLDKVKDKEDKTDWGFDEAGNDTSIWGPSSSLAEHGVPIVSSGQHVGILKPKNTWSSETPKKIYNEKYRPEGPAYSQELRDDLAYKTWADRIYPRFSQYVDTDELHTAHKEAIEFFKDKITSSDAGHEYGLFIRNKMSDKIPQFKEAQVFDDVGSLMRRDESDVKGRLGSSAVGRHDLDVIANGFDASKYTPQDWNLLNAYSRGYDGNLNGVLRAKGDPKLGPDDIRSEGVKEFYLGLTDELNSTITKNKFQNPTQLRRGTHDYYLELIDEKTFEPIGVRKKRSELGVGDVFRDNSFMSTSTHVDGHWGNDRMSEIIDIPGGGVQSFAHPNSSSYSAYPNETEAVLPKGLVRKVEEVNYRPNANYRTRILNPYSMGALGLGAASTMDKKKYGGKYKVK